MTCHSVTMTQSPATCARNRHTWESKSQSMIAKLDRRDAHMNGAHHVKVGNHTATSFLICAAVQSFPAHEKRDGYPWPMHPRTLCRQAVLSRTWWVHLKKPCSSKQNPAYAPIHAHRNLPVECLDICPTGAITSAGDFVEIDPATCGMRGSGLCAPLVNHLEADPSNTALRRIQLDGRV